MPPPTPANRSLIGPIVYLEGVLAPDLRAALEQHVAGCQRCAAFVESYQRTPAILRTATDVTLPPELARTLQAWLHNQKR